MVGLPQCRRCAAASSGPQPRWNCGAGPSKHSWCRRRGRWRRCASPCVTLYILAPIRLYERLLLGSYLYVVLCLHGRKVHMTSLGCRVARAILKLFAPGHKERPSGHFKPLNSTIVLHVQKHGAVGEAGTRIVLMPAKSFSTRTALTALSSCAQVHIVLQSFDGRA